MERKKNDIRDKEKSTVKQKVMPFGIPNEVLVRCLTAALTDCKTSLLLRRNVFRCEMVTMSMREDVCDWWTF